MLDPSASRFIAACWVIFFLYWIAAAFTAKRTAERANWSAWWILLPVAVIILRRGGTLFAGRALLWTASPFVVVVADAITAIGLCVALWARTILGRNWSADVALKHEHELVDRGPYRLVRHPIYTGVLLMVVGTVLLWGRRAGLAYLVLVTIGVAVKAHREERLLTKHFPTEYPQYRALVKAALIPFVI